MNSDGDREFDAAAGSVMDARHQYEVACATQGEDSWAAEVSGDYLRREIAHHDEMRTRLDSNPRERTVPESAE